MIPPQSLTVPPPAFRLSANAAIAIARRTAAVRREERRGHLTATPYISDVGRWEIDFDRGGPFLVEVDVDGVSGRVLVVWTGYAASDYLARGHLGGSLDNPLIFLAFALAFLAPFVDWRRRRVPLDLVVFLGGFGLSYALFTAGQVGWSVPLVYPVLVFLLWRAIGAARGRAAPLASPLSTRWLAAGLAVLVIGHVVLSRAGNTRVIDVGVASVVGADRVSQGEELYVDNNIHGDTYGPISYAAYVPFEAIWPAAGAHGAEPAARAAALTWDLLTLLGLFGLGLRARPGPAGRRLGLLLAWGWAASPFTALALTTNANDGLVALLLVAALVALRSPATRGAFLGLATAAKFAPGALALVLVRAAQSDSRRAIATAAAAFVAVVVLAVALYLPDGGLREFWNSTLGFQLSRGSSFSPWGQHPSLHLLQTAVKVLALATLVWLARLAPARPSLRATAALSAAALIAVQLPATHWFYLYLIWLMPLLMAMWVLPDEDGVLPLRGDPDERALSSA